MAGFRHCSFCYGKGCVACDGEQKKFVAKAEAAAPSWRSPDVRDVRDAWARAERERGWLPNGQPRTDAKPPLPPCQHDWVILAFSNWEWCERCGSIRNSKAGEHPLKTPRFRPET